VLTGPAVPGDPHAVRVTRVQLAAATLAVIANWHPAWRALS
jgi:hypothetical protein